MGTVGFVVWKIAGLGLYLGLRLDSYQTAASGGGGGDTTDNDTAAWIAAI